MCISYSLRCTSYTWYFGEINKLPPKVKLRWSEDKKLLLDQPEVQGCSAAGFQVQYHRFTGLDDLHGGANLGAGIESVIVFIEIASGFKEVGREADGTGFLVGHRSDEPLLARTTGHDDVLSYFTGQRSTVVPHVGYLFPEIQFLFTFVLSGCRGYSLRPPFVR